MIDFAGPMKSLNTLNSNLLMITKTLLETKGPDRDPLDRDPLDRDPLDRDPPSPRQRLPWTESPQIEIPLDRDSPEQRPPR